SLQGPAIHADLHSRTGIPGGRIANVNIPRHASAHIGIEREYSLPGSCGVRVNQVVYGEIAKFCGKRCDARVASVIANGYKVLSIGGRFARGVAQIDRPSQGCVLPDGNMDLVADEDQVFECCIVRAAPRIISDQQDIVSGRCPRAPATAPNSALEPFEPETIRYQGSVVSIRRAASRKAGCKGIQKDVSQGDIVIPTAGYGLVVAAYKVVPRRHTVCWVYGR